MCIHGILFKKGVSQVRRDIKVIIRSVITMAELDNMKEMKQICQDVVDNIIGTVLYETALGCHTGNPIDILELTDFLKRLNTIDRLN